MVVDVDICGLKVGDRHPVHIMGVMNLSRESFYKGSVVKGDALLDVAQKMIDEGATILDLGARSTWPLADPISREEERNRLLPALDALAGNVDAVISVDTMFSDLAEAALNKGADVINDVSGFAIDEKMVDVVADFSCPTVVMASKKVPGDVLGMDEVMQSLANILQISEDKGIDTDRVILDPAIGKWIPEKIPMYDFETFDRFERLKTFNKPILAALSRKSCIGEVLDKPAEDRLYGSLAATAIAVQKGAHIIRTHDVAPTLDAVKVAAAIRGNPPVEIDGEREVQMLEIADPDDSVRLMQSLGVTSTGAQIMKNKTVMFNLLVKNVTTTEALIIKQEILARGGDAALERNAVSHETEKTDLVVMGTLLQLKKLAEKLQGQARGLPKIAEMIDAVLREYNDIEYRYQ
ncbi:dihydropteroate synthase [Methanohalophilus levihalophilus]|uniref:dihydropteroate synthase n=1 Tax=Methanohalophilus levihalophilus TaxID=1431282 RepID=UPI001AE2AF91|nr:dihydropteroate synthase [Methanohalophilus levihalophilus]MBP2030572.1 dihydropteroate synthase [Methanohalophilus levihalophilus]